MKRFIGAMCLTFAFAYTSTACAGYKTTEKLYSFDFSTAESLEAWEANAAEHFRPDEGQNGTGALYFNNTKKSHKWVRLPLDLKKLKGFIQVKAVIRGRDLTKGDKPYFGSKLLLMHTYRTASGKMKTSWPEPKRKFGTFDWRENVLTINIPESTESAFFIVGIQNATGELWLDSVEIWRCEECADDTPKEIPVNLEAQKIPRGKNNGAKYKGFMTGRDMTSEAIQQLAEWGTNLIRYQIHKRIPKTDKSEGKLLDISTPEKYMEMIDTHIAKMDEILESCKKHNIKIAIDLHHGPGNNLSKVSSNLIKEGLNVDTLEAAWIKLATHYKGNRSIYGYDLLNEPANNKVDGIDFWLSIASRLIKTIRKIDQETPIIVETVFGILEMEPMEDNNIIYSPHFYSPHKYTHQGIHNKNDVRWSYPGFINGEYWDKEQLRLSMKGMIEFQQKYNIPIFVGEFSVINWAKGGDRYLADMTELFDEYGWDWTYHAFREYPGWSIEHENGGKPSSDNPRKRALLKALRKRPSRSNN